MRHILFPHLLAKPLAATHLRSVSRLVEIETGTGAGSRGESRDPPIVRCAFHQSSHSGARYRVRFPFAPFPSNSSHPPTLLQSLAVSINPSPSLFVLPQQPRFLNATHLVSHHLSDRIPSEYDYRSRDMNRGGKLAPEVQRALFVKNLRYDMRISPYRYLGHPLTVIIFSYNVSSEELFDLFGKFGPIR